MEPLALPHLRRSMREQVVPCIRVTLRRILLCLSMLCATAIVPSLSHAEDITIYAWGGIYGDGFEKSVAKPFSDQTGIQVNIRPIETSSSFSVNLFAESFSENANKLTTMTDWQAYTACQAGVLANPLAAGWSLPAFKESALPQPTDGGVALSDCAIPIAIHALPYAYHADLFHFQEPPQSLQDFFDVQKYPGARGLWRHPQHTLELALLADGVANTAVYDMLSTREGREQAFEKLDEIKDNIVWWQDFSTLQSALEHRDVAMTFLWSAWTKQWQDRYDIGVVWDQVTAQSDYLGISQGALERSEVRDFVEFTMSADIQKQLSISTRSGSPIEVSKCDDDSECCCEGTSTCDSDCCNTRALPVSVAFWHQYGAEIYGEFEAWLQR